MKGKLLRIIYKENKMWKTVLEIRNLTSHCVMKGKSLIIRKTEEKPPCPTSQTQDQKVAKKKKKLKLCILANLFHL